MSRLNLSLIVLVVSLGAYAPAAGAAQAPIHQPASPALRAAGLAHAEQDKVVRAADAAAHAEAAAQSAIAAAAEAKRAAAVAQQAADKALFAARAAKLALETARGNNPEPLPPLPGGATAAKGLPPAAKPAPALPAANDPVARAYRAHKPAARTAAARPATATPIERAARGVVLRVGPNEYYKVPSEAAKAARHGDTIEIVAGDYRGDVAVWDADNLTIRGVGGRPHLMAAGQAAQRKAIWVIRGDNNVVENIEFSGAKVGGRNGAGIRLEGTGLTIRNSYFHHNEMGLLTGRDPESDVVIENSEFAYNIVHTKRNRPLGHNIYIGEIRSFTLRNSYVHHASYGHNVKSRAATNRILYNRLADEDDGNSSYIVDLPNGGAAYLIGNVLQQSRFTDNWSLVNFGSKVHGPLDSLYLANNTLVSERKSARFVSNRSDRPVTLVNNILVGKGKPVQGPAKLISNLMVTDTTPASIARRGTVSKARDAGGSFAGNLTADNPGFVDIMRRDYRLTPASPAVDAGGDPGTVEGMSLAPMHEFVGQIRLAARQRRGALDLGAYELSRE